MTYCWWGASGLHQGVCESAVTMTTGSLLWPGILPWLDSRGHHRREAPELCDMVALPEMPAPVRAPGSPGRNSARGCTFCPQPVSGGPKTTMGSSGSPEELTELGGAAAPVVMVHCSGRTHAGERQRQGPQRPQQARGRPAGSAADWGHSLAPRRPGYVLGSVTYHGWLPAFVSSPSGGRADIPHPESCC